MLKERVQARSSGRSLRAHVGVYSGWVGGWVSVLPRERLRCVGFWVHGGRTCRGSFPEVPTPVDSLTGFKGPPWSGPCRLGRLSVRLDFSVGRPTESRHPFPVL